MELTLKTTFNTSAEQIYSAWLSVEGHSRMTGGEANASNIIGEEFTCWDEYISGKNLKLEPFKRILQTWRTIEFDENEEDSIIEILLSENNGQTELTLIHTNLPDHGEKYRKGWDESYFQPMKEYFSKK